MPETYPRSGELESGLSLRVAPNPSPMTQAGTNSYVLGHSDVCIVDPGPALPEHIEALVAAVADRPVVAVLVTHSHLDHSPAARPLADRLDAPLLAFGASDAGRSPTMLALSGVGGGEGIDASFAPDATLAQGDTLSGDGWTLCAHHTPGHMANHLAFEWMEARAVFTGDTVMGWASTMISPPDGDLGQFMASLDLLETLDARVFHPGHGLPVMAPSARCVELRAHRRARESALLAALETPRTIPDLVIRLYAETPPALHPAAARNVLAHLLHLVHSGRARAHPAPGPAATWSRT